MINTTVKSINILLGINFSGCSVCSGGVSFLAEYFCWPRDSAKKGVGKSSEVLFLCHVLSLKLCFWSVRQFIMKRPADCWNNHPTVSTLSLSLSPLSLILHLHIIFSYVCLSLLSLFSLPLPPSSLLTLLFCFCLSPSLLSNSSLSFFFSLPHLTHLWNGFRHWPWFGTGICRRLQDPVGSQFLVIRFCFTFHLKISSE